ncbi:MAG: DNA repair protein [Lachnospiraceae bacterium]|nr:DNA repair protein [Lachnospiraceae bacterium]
MERKYLCIDLKSFFASVECVERGLDPMQTRLVVADPERSEKTICLAITPALKKLGIPNRCRVFEIPANVDYIMAPPRMQKYIDYSAKIYGIYLKYVGKDDIHPYSIDECFLDVTRYLQLFHLTARELAKKIIADIYDTLGLVATCGIGTNLYLTKIALDISAKHAKDFMGELDENSYKETLWDHRPLTDFWRIGPGIARRLARMGIFTQRDIANTPEDVLYKAFGIEAELLIDHAWGKEPCTIYDIKHVSAKTHSISRGQVLPRDYSHEECRLIVKEMTDLICLEMVREKVVTDSITLWLGYSNGTGMEGDAGTAALDTPVSASVLWIPAMEELYEAIADPDLPIRRVTVSCNDVKPEGCHQLSFFADEERLEKDRKMQEAVIGVQGKFGRNAVIKGMNMYAAGTTVERNEQIGGHKDGAVRGSHIRRVTEKTKADD